MKEYRFSDKCAELAILMKGGLKLEYYIHKRIFFAKLEMAQKRPIPYPQLPTNSYVHN